MMIKPSIDELLKQTDGNKYVLCTLIAKRAKEIESINLLDSSSEEKKAISDAETKPDTNNKNIPKTRAVHAPISGMVNDI